jgi:putative transcriptional regulator
MANTARFPNRIRELRVAKGLGWSQEKLAREARLSYSAISRLERGERQPSPMAAYRIAKALEVPVEDVFPDMREEAAV